jgi:hypothetical protein
MTSAQQHFALMAKVEELLTTLEKVDQTGNSCIYVDKARKLRREIKTDINLARMTGARPSAKTKATGYKRNFSTQNWLGR